MLPIIMYVSLSLAPSNEGMFELTRLLFPFSIGCRVDQRLPSESSMEGHEQGYYGTRTSRLLS